METECALATAIHQNDTQNNTLTAREKRSIFQPIQGPKSQPKQDPLLEQLDLRQLETVMEAELGCLERMAVKMTQVPDDICYLNEYEIAHQGNGQCWTGTTLGM